MATALTRGKAHPHTCLSSTPIPTHRQRLLVTAIQAGLLSLACTPAWAQQTLAETSLPQVDVTATADAQHQPGFVTTLTETDLEKANSMADVIRYQPLISAPGTANGATRNKSNFDRGGTTGYNIRGIEGNRIGLDIDGVEMPLATSRPSEGRAGVNTFGVGRDFIDPEMYSLVDITSGPTTARRTAGGIGGAVSFKSKSPEQYVSASKPRYFGAKIGYDSADHSWNESVTAAGQNGIYSGLIAYSRRDGSETQNNGSIDANPDNWHSNALLLKGQAQINSEHRLGVSADIYRRKNHTVFDSWNNTGTAITQGNDQRSDTERNTLQLSHLWTPTNLGWLDSLDTRVFYQNTKTADNTLNTWLATGDALTQVSSNKTNTFGLSTSAETRAGRHQIRWGASLSREEKKRRPTETFSFFSFGSSLTTMRYSSPEPDSTTTRAGLYVEDEIRFDANGHRLALIPGLRLDHVRTKASNFSSFTTSGSLTETAAQALFNGTSSTTIFSPSLSLVYDIKPDLSTYVQLKRTGRAPSSSELYGSWSYTGGTYSLLGNRNLKKETSDGIDIGLKGQLVPGVQINSSLFYTRYQNFIAYTRYTRSLYADLFTNIPSTISAIYRAENRDDAKIYGGELAIRVDHGQWVPAAKGFYSTYALGYSKGTSKSSYAGDKNVNLDSVQPAKAILGVGYDAPQRKWGATLMATLVKAKTAQATNRNSFANSGGTLTDSTTNYFRVPGHTTFDLAGYWQISRNVKLSAGVYNLADKRYWDYASSRSLQPSNAQDRRDIELLTNPGRTAAVALSVEF